VTWGNRVRLMLGLVVVVVAVALATYHLNEAEAVATSASAQIAAQAYDVGSPYAGLVVDQPVQVGDSVKEGDTMFVLQSTALQHDIAIGLGPKPSAAAGIDAQGNLVVRATAAGVVSELSATRGSFVQASSQLARVEKAGTLYVLADYVLTPTDYARIPDRAAVTIVLPNQQSLAGHVQRVDVATVANKAQATITIVSDALVAGDANGLVSAGTPVTAELHLRNDGVVTSVADSVKRYLHGIRL
jgi:multidrug resistance efflux pump